MNIIQKLFDQFKKTPSDIIPSAQTFKVSNPLTQSYLQSQYGKTKWSRSGLTFSNLNSINIVLKKLSIKGFNNLQIHSVVPFKSVILTSSTESIILGTSKS